MNVPNRREVNFWEYADEILTRMRGEGLLCTVVDKAGKTNVLTLGWGQIGPFYHGHPVCSIAVTPLRYSWRFLEEVPEFVLAVPDDSLKEAAQLCGTESGRDMDKFERSGLTRVKSRFLQAPSIKECPINIECRIYARLHPPHELLSPEHRKRPVKQQHTIYFAEALGTYAYRS